MKRLLGLMAGLWLTAGVSHAQELTERTLSPFFSVEGAAEGVEPFALEATHVTAHVNGVIADVTVSQRYRNGGDVPLHARYIFPASTRAAVHGLSMQVGDKRVRAKIREREVAKQEFELAARSGKTASLLEQTRPNVFSMAVSNILPGDRVEVELRYSELLVPTDGVYELVYPTVVGPRYASNTMGTDPPLAVPYLPRGDSPDTAFSMDVSLSTGVPLADVRSSSHKLNVVSRETSSARIALAKDGLYAGIGSSVNRYLIEGLARAGRGEPFIVTRPAEAASAAERFRRYIQSPLLRDVRVQFRGFDAYDVEPSVQPDLFAQRPIVVFGKWRGPRAGSVEVSASAARGVFRNSLPVANTQPRSEHDALPQLWARTRIASLSDFTPDAEENRAQITKLGLAYSLLTAHTSFIAVLEQIRNPGGLAADSAVPQALPLGMSEAGETYESGAEPELLLLLAAALGLLMLRQVRRRATEERAS
jgi:hypothetical protein